MTAWTEIHLYKDWDAIIGIHFPKEYCEFVKENWKNNYLLLKEIGYID